MANDRVPINYQTPSFPSLYDPLQQNTAYYLYHTNDIWRFTLYWTFIFYGATHLLVAAYTVLTHFRHWSIIWLVPIVYAIIAAVEALLAGSIIGLVLGAVYEAGNFRMSTFLPMIWGGVNVMVLIVTSFPMQGGL
ncbi:Uncharacterized protein PECH_001511 [Penicillium ucsense]|uniref:Integral membrane protein n=2 Tax=Penicillium TaxID=5073 RepID=A0A8J8W7I0_9EURO|nr:uncharacterized protein N7539_005444 [Penicillium diatomitis]KAF7719518.1 Uncharacterized protein PECM_006374 [Penicillium ucsense]KAF7732690.1 Uncharacterized protein PECH_001511 [Penicillium ucsense]KAJ5485456.1 hypothetical protein N7539_005444 [Penicillium diatomitis]